MKFVIEFDGKRNLKAVEKFVGDKCYAIVANDDGEYIGQLEEVLYYGERGFCEKFNPKKEGLVAFSYIDLDKVEDAIDFLLDIGVNGKNGIFSIRVDDEWEEENPGDYKKYNWFFDTVSPKEREYLTLMKFATRINYVWGKMSIAKVMNRQDEYDNLNKVLKNILHRTMDFMSLYAFTLEDICDLFSVDYQLFKLVEIR